MGDNGLGEWRGLVQAAIQEADSETFARRLDEAEESIHHRLAQLSASVDHHEELMFVRDALRSIEFLRRLSPYWKPPIEMKPPHPARDEVRAKRQVGGLAQIASQLDT
jgi:hypothetical protein